MWGRGANIAPVPREAGGIKDQNLLNNFLSKMDGGGPAFSGEVQGHADDRGKSQEPVFVESTPGSSSMDPSAPSENVVSKASKFNKNKICKPLSSSSSARPQDVFTPLLNALPPLRRAQILQIVSRQVKATGRPENDRNFLAEEYMLKADGDYDTAYKLAKDESAEIVRQHLVSQESS
jgi:hypothetical protein